MRDGRPSDSTGHLEGDGAESRQLEQNAPTSKRSKPNPVVNGEQEQEHEELSVDPEDLECPVCYDFFCEPVYTP